MVGRNPHFESKNTNLKSNKGTGNGSQRYDHIRQSVENRLRNLQFPVIIINGERNHWYRYFLMCRNIATQLTTVSCDT